MLTLFSHAGTGPNGWKVAIVLEELGLKYETKYLEITKGETKTPEYTKYNPNGRVPCIIDHDNNDFVIWESTAIIQYIVDRYDKENKVHYPFGTDEYYSVAQWMAFQVSGQGPYFGQAAWFKNHHPEKLPSAIDRYEKEIQRVISVLDGVLSTRKYLVGDKCTVADLVFIPWNFAAPFLVMGNESVDLSKYTNFKRWHDDLCTRDAVVKIYKEKARLTEVAKAKAAADAAAASEKKD